MKKYIKYFVLISMTFIVSLSCEKKDRLSSTSVVVDSERKQTDFDKWLSDNYLDAYNIQVKYRLEDKESAMNYDLIPPQHEKSVQISKLVLYLCLQAYDEVTGSREFMRSYFPKILHLVGSGAYNNNGTYILGTAEGGMKINLFDINSINLKNLGALNERYFNTIHHEFSHILHQTKPYATNFKEISAARYVGDSWNSKYKSNNESLKDGFISPYSSKNSDEDFVELIARYVTNSPETWESYIEKGNADEGNGGVIIKAKFEIVTNYLSNSWGINIHKLRSEVQRRQKFVEDNGIPNI